MLWFYCTFIFSCTCIVKDIKVIFEIELFCLFTTAFFLPFLLFMVVNLDSHHYQYKTNWNNISTSPQYDKSFCSTVTKKKLRLTWESIYNDGPCAFIPVVLVFRMLHSTLLECHNWNGNLDFFTGWHERLWAPIVFMCMLLNIHSKNIQNIKIEICT